MTSLDTDVVVVGGGVTGVAVLRDLALRGVHAVLVERFDLGTGTSGRWHGLLHSGARYAVRDQESARECIEENTVLRRIAPHTIEDVGGLFVLLPGDDEAYAGQFVDGCRASGIPTEELSAAAARRREPLLAPGVKLAYAVPDGGIDSWGLLRSMAADAEARGCRVLVRHPVVGVERDGDRIAAVRVHDQVAGEDRLIGCQWVVNAAGAWAGEVGRMAGVPIRMIAGKGVMVVMASRYVRGVVNACRKPADGDIIVPQHEVAVLGTTSVQVDSPDDITVAPADVDRMVDMCAQMVPSIATGRVLRAFAGSRPLYQPESADGGSGGGDTREVSRTFTVLDHASRDGLANMLSIVGGKLTTCRQMAEALVDRLAERMGVTEPCRTATEPLPGADHGPHRLAAPLAAVEREVAYGELICECELVTRDQVRAAVAGGLTELEDLRRKLRLGYGPCQAAFCAWRAAGMLAEGREPEGSGRGGPGDPEGGPRWEGPQVDPARAEDALAGLERFLEERWRGQQAATWGDQARQALLNHAIYRGIFDLRGAGRPDEAAAAGLARTEPGEGDPTTRVGSELVGESNGRTSSKAGG
ncbi:MAG TPA: anaerobic glycerol-3-phosphate dehydrogenase subunit GlpA [Actinomycetes bacterium]|nr:anaerobic glycerol-3-phosphate dehydrogenase subunit GlpA [Actinomycetes bacterium]